MSIDVNTIGQPFSSLALLLLPVNTRSAHCCFFPKPACCPIFIISNLGMFDVEEFVAIINPPEAAILAVGTTRDAPVVHNGQVVPGKTMKVTISADHRATDGAEAAKFLQEVKKNLEEPLRLLV